MTNLEPQVPEAIDLDFERESVNKLYRKGAFGRINPKRKERVWSDIPFEDLVSELTGQSPNSQDKIVCPIHGDSDASFQIYKRSNSGFCFGCPPGKQYYEHIGFTSALTGMNWLRSLKWLEKKWELPELPNLAAEDEEEERDEDEAPTVQLSFADLVQPYMCKAEASIQQFMDYDLAMEYESIYFDALHLMELAKVVKQEHDDAEEGAEEAKSLEAKATLYLARVVGKKTIDRILQSKY